jgi:hypothetical protein
MNSKNKNIRDLYRGTKEFKRGYHPRNNLVKDKNGVLLADAYNILNSGRNIFLSYLMCMSVMLGRQKYIQLNH